MDEDGEKQFQALRRIATFSQPMRPFSVFRRLAFSAAWCVPVTLLLGCQGAAGGESRNGDSVSAVAVETPPPGVTALPAADTVSRQPSTPSATHLSPLADTIAQRLVFAPITQRWFVAAARGKRLVVDLGRIDIDVKKSAAREAAFVEAAEGRSPVAKGSRLRLRGDWGSDDATVAGFAPWNGRIVAHLDPLPRVDSLAKVTDPFVASAERSGDAAAPTEATCDRTADSVLVDRLKSVAAEALDSLKAGEQPLYPRLQRSVRSRTSVVAGCFGDARGIATATLYAGDYEWVRERVFLVGEGTPKRLTVRDLRFRAHEALQAIDADGDGVDDLVARAWAPRSGGTVVLSLREGARLERLAAGFSWER